jgi:hypothetical protein
LADPPYRRQIGVPQWRSQQGGILAQLLGFVDDLCPQQGPTPSRGALWSASCSMCLECHVGLHFALPRLQVCSDNDTTCTCVERARSS